MNKGLGFRHAAALVGEKHPAFKALDTVLGGALLIGTAGGSELAFGLFDAKAEFITKASDLGDAIVKGSQGLDRFQRTERIEAANSVLLVVSFFETLALLDDREFFIDENAKAAGHKSWSKVSSPVTETIARTIRRRVRAAYQEQARIAGGTSSVTAQRAARRKLTEEAPTLPSDRIHQILVATTLQPNDKRIATIAHVLLDAELPAPGPHLPYEIHLQEVATHFHELASGYAEASLGLDWETLEASEQTVYQDALATWVATFATLKYRGYFQKLAGLSQEVAFWANSIDHQATRHQIEQLRVGLAGLREGLKSDWEGRTGVAAAALARLYESVLERPVVSTNELMVAGMHVPKLKEIYIHPEFRALRSPTSARLELESTWADASRREDIQSFLVGYLSTPAATLAPLLVLGQPGSGKSVLTKVLSARLPAQEFLPVRIVLREIPADTDVQSQIEAAVFSDTGERVSWTQLVDDAAGTIPVLLFDGFDELLQATGITQSDFLERVARFQDRERSLGRPCVAIVTSRTAVADRARVPHAGMTVIRIEPFSKGQVERWTAVWNLTNATFFSENGLRPLSSSVVLTQQDLSSQPLLLLMLALYDANGNALQQLTAGEDRSSLYERLLAAFARREIEKSGSPLRDEEIIQSIEDQIHELSVAALAMFNRSRQWVLVQELDHDLTALKAPSTSGASGRETEFRRAYSAAEALIGRFFFVHEARAIVGERTIGTIEFLHATFGEYLVARAVHREVKQLVAQEKFLRESARRSVLSDEYLAALLTFAGLSSRATILEFLRELFADLWDGDREILRDVLQGFFIKSVRGRPPSEFEDYKPAPISYIAGSANYSFNLLAILLLEGRPIEVAALVGAGDDPNDAWSRHASFLRSQLAKDAWVWLSTNVVCRRTGNSPDRATTLQLLDDAVALTAVTEGDEVPGDWHYELSGTETGSVVEVDDYARVIRSNRLASDADSDLAVRCVEPVVQEIGSMFALAAIGPSGVRVTGAEALIRLWIASSGRSGGVWLTAAYDDCIKLALAGQGPGAEVYRSILVRQLAKDLSRLPGRWREETRRELEQHASVDSGILTWVQLMFQSLGFRGKPSEQSSY